MFDDWLPRVMPYAPGCPTATALLHITDAAQDYCKRTLCWSYQHAPILTLADVSAYPLALGAGVVVARMVSCRVDGHDEFAVSSGSLGREAARTASSVCLFDGSSSISLSPVPAIAGRSIVVELAVMPDDSGLTVWPAELAEHVRYIAAGAIATLCAMPKVEWADRDASAMNMAIFEKQIATQKIKATRSRVWPHGAKTVWF